MKSTIIHGIEDRYDKKEKEDIIRSVFLEASDNCSFLSKHDRVLLKPALNSSDPYPSTTDPLTVRVIADLLKEKGAVVIIGDQSGIGHVLHTSTGVVRGSSRDNFKKSSMGDGLDDVFKAFEEEGWDQGFDRYSSKYTKAWPHGFFITRWVKEVDHIINLPRISTHAQTGVTLGFKNMVGLLREDSRMEFHAHGPFFDFMNTHSGGVSKAKKMYDPVLFFNKITEISDALRNKMRVTLYMATKVQTTFGPDKRVMGIVPSHVSIPSPGVVIASSDQIMAEAIALAFLTIVTRKLKFDKKILELVLRRMNPLVKNLEKTSIWENPFITHALYLKLGKKTSEVIYKNIPENLQYEFNHLI